MVRQRKIRPSRKLGGLIIFPADLRISKKSDICVNNLKTSTKTQKIGVKWERYRKEVSNVRGGKNKKKRIY